MKTLNANGEALQAERVVKEGESITGYVNGRVVFCFKGVRDFEKYTLDGEWDEAGNSVDSQLAFLIEENERLVKRLDSNEDAVLSLMDISMMGGM